MRLGKPTSQEEPGRTNRTNPEQAPEDAPDKVEDECPEPETGEQPDMKKSKKKRIY